MYHVRMCTHNGREAGRWGLNTPREREYLFGLRKSGLQKTYMKSCSTKNISCFRKFKAVRNRYDEVLESKKIPFGTVSCSRAVRRLHHVGNGSSHSNDNNNSRSSSLPVGLCSAVEYSIDSAVVLKTHKTRKL